MLNESNRADEKPEPVAEMALPSQQFHLQLYRGDRSLIGDRPVFDEILPKDSHVRPYTCLRTDATRLDNLSSSTPCAMMDFRGGGSNRQLDQNNSPCRLMWSAGIHLKFRAV